MKKKKKEEVNNVQKAFLLMLSIATVVFISLYLYFSYYNNSLNNTLKEEGYDSDKDTDFYEKVETGNTIEEYNQDVKNDKNSEFIKFYVTKELNNFVEVKMAHKDGVSTTLNINANLKNDKIDYNYELSYKNTYLIFEGNTDNNYDCHYVVEENISQETMEKHCNYVKDEIEVFIEKKKEFLNNSEISKRIG